MYVSRHVKNALGLKYRVRFVSWVLSEQVYEPAKIDLLIWRWSFTVIDSQTNDTRADNAGLNPTLNVTLSDLLLFLLYHAYTKL